MFVPKIFQQSICLSCLISRVQSSSSFRNVKSCLRITKGTDYSRAVSTGKVYASKNSTEKSDVVTKEFFDKVRSKDKQNYLDMVRIFEGRGPHRRGHVEFIYAALRHMEEFGVHKDLEAYKRLVDVFPKGKFIPTNIFQAEFMHYPKQQQCAIDLLDQMEENGVIPDAEVEEMLLNIFGKSGHPLRKYWRMMYWMPKFKNLNPWPLPQPVPNDSLELAKLALKQMSSVDLQSSVVEYKVSTCITKEPILGYAFIFNLCSLNDPSFISISRRDLVFTDV